MRVATDAIETYKQANGKIVRKIAIFGESDGGREFYLSE